MRMYDLIEKKKSGETLSDEEIKWMIDGYTTGNIPDYQMSAMLMAIYFKGMSDEETTAMTLAMAHSGDMLDLSAIKGIKADKHSTGGVGDKTTLIVVPIVAACGVNVAKMSGRGLGHTGGTIDKLESIDGFKTTLTRDEFFENVNKYGLSVIGQSGNITPADKKIYALRDVTATVDSIPLIASSIMSKKLAAGSDVILLDVKTGSGAFMRTKEGSIELAKKMVSIGNKAGRKTAAIITNMDIPLGNAIGNSLEVIEAVNSLKGNGPTDLMEVCIQLAAMMIYMAQKATDMEQAVRMANDAIESKAALTKLKEMVIAQHGDVSLIEDTDKFTKAKFSHKVLADKDGYVSAMDAHKCGIASMLLGAGRQTKDDSINPAAGIIIERKNGDKIVKGDVLATLYADDESLFEKAEQIMHEAYHFSDTAPQKEKLIIEYVMD